MGVWSEKARGEGSRLSAASTLRLSDLAPGLFGLLGPGWGHHSASLQLSYHPHSGTQTNQKEPLSRVVPGPS